MVRRSPRGLPYWAFLAQPLSLDNTVTPRVGVIVATRITITGIKSKIILMADKTAVA
jgi:hypothetical protein